MFLHNSPFLIIVVQFTVLQIKNTIFRDTKYNR